MLEATGGPLANQTEDMLNLNRDDTAGAERSNGYPIAQDALSAALRISFMADVFPNRFEIDEQEFAFPHRRAGSGACPLNAEFRVRQGIGGQQRRRESARDNDK